MRNVCPTHFAGTPPPPTRFSFVAKTDASVPPILSQVQITKRRHGKDRQRMSAMGFRVNRRVPTNEMSCESCSFPRVPNCFALHRMCAHRLCLFCFDVILMLVDPPATPHATVSSGTGIPIFPTKLSHTTPELTWTHKQLLQKTWHWAASPPPPPSCSSDPVAVFLSAPHAAPGWDATWERVRAGRMGRAATQLCKHGLEAVEQTVVQKVVQNFGFQVYHEDYSDEGQARSTPSEGW